MTLQQLVYAVKIADTKSPPPAAAAPPAARPAAPRPRALDEGVVAAAQSMGATPFQINTKVMIPE